MPHIFSLALAIAALVIAVLSAGAIGAQEPVVVQPGAPGQPTKVLPSSTRGKLPPTSRKDIEFMQGMIMHHQQAVEMTDMIEERTRNKDVRLIGARIAQSQTDEMNFMKRWLELRGEPVEHKMTRNTYAAGHQAQEKEPPKGVTPNAPAHGHEPPKAAAPNAPHKTGTDAAGHLMPGMLTKAQMDGLRKARGAEFDHLFLTGMIQHHNGALVMVKELFDTAGAGQDAELFSFATDVDSGQRAEIKSMQTLLDKHP